MRCPKCSHNHPYKAGMKCGKCGYGFVLDPKSGLRIADGRFQNLIRKASADDTAYFTRRQLYATLCRQLHRSVRIKMKVAVVLAILDVVIVALVFASTERGAEARFPVAMLGGFFLFVFALMTLAWVFYRPPNPERFEEAIDRWERANGPIGKLISKPTLQEPPPEWKESDVYDYGVERILVVQRDVLVDLFVRNGWHAENRALVLAKSGYPEYLLPVARKLLQERPDLPVFLLHDSDRRGMAMEDQLRSGDLLPLEGHPVSDLGISPRDVARLDRLAPLRPKATDHEVPVDSLAYGTLATGVGAAVIGSVTLGSLLDEAAQRAAAGGMEASFG